VYADAARHSVLVIDAHAASRAIVCSMLRDLGFGVVKQVAKASDGLALLTVGSYDVVICDAVFEGESITGAQLLAQLRRDMLLPFTSVFVLLSGRATYTHVVEAAEFALDGYLVKPFNANTFSARLTEARARKLALANIYEALELGEVARAISLCQTRFVQRSDYWIQAARIGAELLLQQDRPQDARDMYAAIAQTKAIPWARLGLVRTHVAEGCIPKAKKAAEELLSEDPKNADAHAMLGRIHLEAGSLAQALASYTAALEITPECALRSQIAGSLSFYSGSESEALTLLDRSWGMSRGTHLLDVLTVVQASYLRFEVHQTTALRSSVEILREYARAHPNSFRLRHFEMIGAVLLDLSYGRSRDAIERARSVHRPLLEPTFDLEAGLNTLSLLVRLLPFNLPERDFENVTRTVARRFVNKATAPFLVAVVARHAPASQWIHEAQEEISKLTERAVEISLAGRHRNAVEFLLTNGESNRNARLFELAGNLVKRHREQSPELSELVGRLGLLRRRFGGQSNHVAGLRRSLESSGGVLPSRATSGQPASHS
jgi:CheY-like chemotaxis protein